MPGEGGSTLFLFKVSSVSSLNLTSSPNLFVLLLIFFFETLIACVFDLIYETVACSEFLFTLEMLL